MTADNKPLNESREAPRPGLPGPASAGAAASCPACGGSGRVVLLTSIGTCRLCRGDGRADASGTGIGRTVEEADGTIRTYDALGRVIQVVRPDTLNTWSYESCTE
jgi:hypothetical protein